jgi:hypothetical protein
MIVAVVALLVAASLSVGLRATAGWLDHWHPIDRLMLATILGGVMLAASLTMSSRFGVIQAGYGLAFSLAPVGVYDVVKWWYRSRRTRTAWLFGADASSWVLVLRWAALIGLIAMCVWLLMPAAAASSLMASCGLGV